MALASSHHEFLVRASRALRRPARYPTPPRALRVHQAEETPVEIVPKFAHGKLHLIRRDYGPFEPQVLVEVPLWLAVQLRRRQVCARPRRRRARRV